MSQLALITFCNQGHGPLSECLSRSDGRIEGEGLNRGRWLMWQASSSIHTTLVSAVNLRCQHFCSTTTKCLPALKAWFAVKSGLLDLGEHILWNGKSMFYQTESDRQGVTWRPSHLTDTNGCTGLPVQANTLPSKSACQIDSTESGAIKYQMYMLQIWWPRSSIRIASSPPAGLKLSLGMANIPVLW